MQIEIRFANGIEWETEDGQVRGRVVFIHPREIGEEETANCILEVTESKDPDAQAGRYFFARVEFDQKPGAPDTFTSYLVLVASPVGYVEVGRE